MTLRMTIDRPLDVLSQGEHLGFPWVTMKNGMGYRCGYVGIPKGHPWYGKGYDELCPEVHGGLTYADLSEDESVWWMGFDCAHYMDAPDPQLVEAGYCFTRMNPAAIIRSQDYVESNCHTLCEQAKEEK